MTSPPPVNPIQPPQVEPFPVLESLHHRRPTRRRPSLILGFAFAVCFLIGFGFFVVAIIDESAVRVAAYSGLACFWAIMARIMQAEQQNR